MQIRLENIGIVKDSTIALDGLTVITGKNNSGKTTVGKVLYSLVDAVSNLEQKVQKDRQYYIRKQLETVESTLEVFRSMRIFRKQLNLDFFNDYPAMKLLFEIFFQRKISSKDIEKYAHDLASELTAFDVSLLEKNIDNHDLLQYTRPRLFSPKTNIDNISFATIFDTQRKNALLILEQLFSDLDKDVGLVNYIRESINQTLQIEFSNQIQPISTPVPYSKIELSDVDSTYFNITLTENNIVNDGMPVFFSTPYRKVYMIDNPFVLDDTSSEKAYHEFDKWETETILNKNRIDSHNDKLRSVLRKQRLNILEQTVLDNSLKAVKAQIDQIIPGTFEFSSDGEYYVQNGKKLKISNLATGSKMFSIIKILLANGEIDSSTMLILDEPEAHLHPQWQNAFAEIIVLLVKELNANILLTTHSSNFMLALDANMRKYNMADKTNFYQTDIVNDCFVQYHCVNDDMGKIYQDFLQYLSEAKMLRNMYLYNTEE